MKDFFIKNLSLKFLSLLLAVSLWVYVATVENRIDYFPGDIPIETKNLAPTLAPVYDQDTVRIKISASSTVWKKLVQDDFSAYADLANLSLGTHQVDVKVTSSLPGVQIVEIDPEQIRIRIETAITREVSVATKIEGKLAAGYEIIETKIDPNKVEAKGAKDIINNVSQATAVIKLSGEDRDIKEKVRLVAFDEFDQTIKNVIFTPERIEAIISIAKEGGGKIVGIKPKIVGSIASGYWVSSITFEPSVVRILGSEDKIKNIEYLETKEIDISGLSQNKESEVDLVLPAGISVMSGESKAILVKILVTLSPQSREVIAGFSYTNLGVGLSVSGVSPGQVKVMVSGPSSLLKSLSSDNVVINLDLGGRGAGSQIVSIRKDSISVPTGVSIISYLPNNITITIQ